MADLHVAPYGAWKSPITSDLIVPGTIGLGQVALDGEDVYWIEMRPTEGGRNVIVRRTSDGRMIDLTPAPFNARTRVHEYDGGAFVVSDGTIYFAHFADQCLYRQTEDTTPQPLTPAADVRYADGVVDRHRGRMIWVCEDHTVSGREAVNALVSLDLRGGDDRVLVSGNDFYSSPRLSPDGSRLAWLTWNHPNMSWDGTELWVGEVMPDGSLGHTECVAGGAEESTFQPEWSPDVVLYFISDRTGWWNLYRWREGRIDPLCPMAAEFGRPQWVFGMSTYTFASAGRIICAYTTPGTWRLASLDTEMRHIEPIEMPYTEIWEVRAASGRVVFGAGSPTEPASIVQLDLGTRQLHVLKRSSTLAIDSGYLSTPQAIEFPTEHGLTAHALFYAPRNRNYVAPASERPPLLVKSHGGPTSAAQTTLNLGIQY